jgi:hypothetical protein
MSKQKLTDRQRELVQCSKWINTYWKRIADKHQHNVLSIDEFNKFADVLWDWGEVLNRQFKECSEK